MAVIKSASLQRLRVARVFAAAVLSLLATSVRAQEAAPDSYEPRQVISLGFGLANGGFGVEYFREINEHVAFSGGIGATGFGARGQWRMSRTPFGPLSSTLYASGGATVFAWGDHYSDSNGMALLEVGVQLWPQAGSLRADAGAGIGFAFGAPTRGNEVVPTLRFLVGYTLR